jgi:hypothetical protein
MIPATTPSFPPADPDLTLTPATAAYGDPAQAQRCHEAILQMTAEVFPGAKIELGTGIDPEIEGDEYPVVSVAAPGTVDELVSRNGEWHERMRAIIGPHADGYRLDLHVA